MSKQVTLISIFVLFLTTIGSSVSDTRGRIIGQVTDSNKRAIVGPIVKSVNIETNQTTKSKTTSTGNFTLTFLNPGTYNVEVSAKGYQTLKRYGVVVSVADKIHLSLEMASELKDK